MEWHDIEATIRYSTPDEGGRKTGVASGYRGQFFYGGEDYDGIQNFPDLAGDQIVELGCEVRAIVRFPQDRWEKVHQYRLHDGMRFQIREGARVVGNGIVTRLTLKESNDDA